MNLVNLIAKHLSDDAVGQLASIIGAGEKETQSAVGAAVPALLSGLSNLANSAGGAQKIISALGKFDAGSLGNLSDMLTNQPSSVLDQGSRLLDALMGGNMLSSITSAVSRFAGIGSGSVQKLLGYLMPFVLGGIAGRFAGKSLSPQGLASMFAEQKANIADGFPSNFSLSALPGMAAAGSAARAAGSAARAAVDTARPAASSALRWLLPVAGLALLALVLWALVRPTSTAKPPVAAIPSAGMPEVARLTTDLTGDFKSLTGSLADIRDASSAAAAIPKINELGAKLDGMKAMVDKLPEAGKTQVMDLIKSKLGEVENQFAKLAWIPGVGDKIKPAMDDIIGKLASLGGVPVPQTANVSSALASTFSSMTETLGGIKDTASAEAALPKLREINDKLDASKNMMAGLSAGGRSTITTLLQTAISKLRELADKVLAIAGAGDKVKPVLDSILGKLNALAA
jgi:hypothetical protein